MLIAETTRMTLGYLAVDDAAFIKELYNTEGFLRFVGDKQIHSLDAAKAYLNTGPLKMYTEKGFGLYKMTLTETGSPIGVCGLIKRDSLEDVDLGYGILPEFEGQGLISEAARATLKYAHEELKLTRVVAITLEDNGASGAVLRKLGFSFERMILQGPGEPELQLYALDF